MFFFFQGKDFLIRKMINPSYIVYAVWNVLGYFLFSFFCSWTVLVKATKYDLNMYAINLCVLTVKLTFFQWEKTPSERPLVDKLCTDNNPLKCSIFGPDLFFLIVNLLVVINTNTYVSAIVFYQPMISEGQFLGWDLAIKI